MREEWVGLESNPEVMTKYARALGVDTSWAFLDVWGIDKDTLDNAPTPAVAVVFLYPYSKVEARKSTLGAERGRPNQNVWFMKQTVSNACGAVAIMHAVMNNRERLSSKADLLGKFAQDTSGADASERGRLFVPAMRGIHLELAPEGQTSAPKATADLDFHFVTYIAASDGHVHELDGNNDGPIDCGPVGPHPSLLHAVVAYVKEAYIAPFPDCHFSLMMLGPAGEAAGN